MAKAELNNIKSWEINIEDVTPGMKQYLEIKRENPNMLLLYRLGDFYESFFEDAHLLSKELEVALTGRESGILGRIPLAGIPVKYADSYIEKLVQKNIKVAICDQLEEQKGNKDLVKRGVTRIVTAGTLIESDFLQQNANNYICAMFKDEKNNMWGFSYADISTGEFKTTQAPFELILAELARIKPAEIIAPAKKQELKPFQIVPEEIIDLPESITDFYNCSKIPYSVFEPDFAENNLKAVFETQSLDSFGYSEYKLGFRASGALLSYIWETQKGNMPKFERIQTYELNEFVIIDVNTRRNLELTETLREKNKYGSLLWAIDKTKTNMGARLLRNWICQPLKNVGNILKRQNTVTELVEKSKIRTELMHFMEQIYDIQRLSTRISNGSVTPKDFISLKNSLKTVPDIIETAQVLENNPFKDVECYKNDFLEYADLIERTIKEEPSIHIKDGGVIKEGVNGELDYFRELLTGGENWLKEFEEREREATGIKTLKVRCNKVFGYYIEVTNVNVSMVPDYYLRKQTLVNAERYITEDLKKHEDDVLAAKFKSTELEYKIFCDFREYSKEFVTKIRELSEAIAYTDTICSLAQTAVENNYVRPEIDNSDDIIIKNGRHAVLEKILPLGDYVPNDLELKSNSVDVTQFMILTGPNMAGKSTYMRQNALILILAQIGSWIPADYGKIGVADKIFTRVGASDDLTLGKSTFMVEMIETANIINTATERSFILLDEIGRGTSTYDGVAIAWSVAEHIATKIKARCIFATHYHELNVMTKSYPQIKNYRVTISEQNGEIEYLRKIVQGGSSKSYGIQVAKMAGLPPSILKRSQDLMVKMQKAYASNLSTNKKSEAIPEIPQLSLFNS